MIRIGVTPMTKRGHFHINIVALHGLRHSIHVIGHFLHRDVGESFQLKADGSHWTIGSGNVCHHINALPWPPSTILPPYHVVVIYIYISTINIHTTTDGIFDDAWIFRCNPRGHPMDGSDCWCPKLGCGSQLGAQMSALLDGERDTQPRTRTNK